MSPTHTDPLDVIYEDDETDEGAISLDGGTSLYGHPDHEHRDGGDEDVRVLEEENGLLRENVAALIREVQRADAEMARWRTRCRKIEDERDALSRELDRFKAEFDRCTRSPQGRQHHPQSIVVYSTSREPVRLSRSRIPLTAHVSDPIQGRSTPEAHARAPSPSTEPSPSPPTYFTPAIAISPTREPTPPTAGIPTHRGRLAPPRSPQVQPLPSPVLYSTGTQDGWGYFDIPRERDRELIPPPTWATQAPVRERSYAAAAASPVVYSSGASPLQDQPFLYASAYPHPNGHGQGHRERGENERGTPHAPQHPDTQPDTRPRLASAHPPRLHPVQPPVRKPSDEPASLSCTSSSASHDAHENPFPRTPLDAPVFDFPGSKLSPAPTPAPAPAPASAPAPAPARPSSAHTPFSPAAQPFSPARTFSPAAMHHNDPEFGPVIVHGPLPPRHQAASSSSPASPPRRKREPASVPPRHLAPGKKAPAAFGGAAMGMGGGIGMDVRVAEWGWGKR